MTKQRCRNIKSGNPGFDATWLHVLMVLLCLGFAASAGAAETGTPDPASKTGGALFDGAKQSVIQVVTTKRLATQKYSHGTGFMVSGDGLLVTNFHVVKDYVFEPEKFDLHYRTQQGKKGNLTVLAVDAVNDLAVLKSDLRSDSPMVLSADTPRVGETTHALGFPIDEGLTIVSGTFNGKSENKYVDSYHFSGPLNSGMSGGPPC